jgi:putative ABC transport system permease protein
VVIAVAIGVFSFGAMAIGREVMLADMATGFRATNPATIQMNISPFDEYLVRVVNGYREVEQAEGQASVRVKYITGKDSFIPLTLYAFHDYADMQVNKIAPEAGRWPPQRREILLERTSLPFGGVEIGDVITIELPDESRYDLPVTGSVHDLNIFPANMNQEMTGYVSLETIEYLQQTGLYGRMNIITQSQYTTLEEIEGVALTIKERLEREGYEVSYVQSNRPNEHFTHDVMQGMAGFQYMMGVAALVLSGFLVWNTISSVLVQHRRQIGILKAVGARGPQIATLYLAMVATYGLLALIIAVPVSIVLGYTYIAGPMQMLNFDILGLFVPGWVLVAMLLTAVLTPILAALLPVLTGTRITVREAISDYGITRRSGSDLIERALERLRGLPRPVVLSLRNTFRQRGRLLLTLSTLGLAGSVFIGVLSMRDSLFLEIDNNMRISQEDVTLNLVGLYPVNTLEREARRVPGVTHVEAHTVASMSLVRADGSQGSTFPLIGVPPDTAFVQPILIAGRWLEPGDQNAVVLSSEMLRDNPGIDVGNTITLEHEDTERKREWKVVGIYQATWYSNSYTTYDSLSHALNTNGLASRLVVATEQHTLAYEEQAGNDLEEGLDRAGIDVASWRTFQEHLDEASGQFGGLISTTMAVAIFLAIVGGLGLAGTMGLNVLERTREIGVMRSIGASNGAIRRVVLTEGLTIGLLSWLIAVVVTIPVGRGLSAMMGSFIFNRPATPAYSVTGALLWLPIVLLIALVSSLMPARRAVRVSVREALAYE